MGSSKKPPTRAYKPTPLEEDIERRKLRQRINQKPSIKSGARELVDLGKNAANRVREGVRTIKRSVKP